MFWRCSGGESLKWIKLTAAVLLLSLVLSGCSFRFASSVDELISPVSPQGDDADVQNALSSYVSGGYTLKTPSGGEFTTAFSFFDVDGDSADEAVVFYEPEKTPGKICMAVIDKTAQNWSVIYNISSEYSDVYSLSFSDLTGDGILEFVVLWDVISNSTNHVLTVYRQNTGNGYSLEPVGSELTVNNCIVVDMDLDSVNEMLAFTIETGDEISASATLYEYSDGGRETIGRTKLDGHISYYDDIQYDVEDDRVYIYADAVKSDGTQMLTEVIYWSDYYNTIISPFYSYSSGVTNATSRSVMLNCSDVDEDGITEIPTDAQKDAMPADVYAVEWNKYNDSVLVKDCSSIVVVKDEYQLIISDAYFDKIKVLYSPEDSLLTVTDQNDEILFSVMCVLKAHYDSASTSFAGFTAVAESSGYVYLVHTENGGNGDFSADAVKSMLRTYKGE